VLLQGAAARLQGQQQQQQYYALPLSL
jgi:hypothetical protein